MIKLKLIILFSLLYVIGYSQIPGPSTNWYFGTNAGITFNSGPPAALTINCTTASGQICQEDVYVYHIVYKGFNRRYQDIYGKILLIK